MSLEALEAQIVEVGNHVDAVIAKVDAVEAEIKSKDAELKRAKVNGDLDEVQELKKVLEYLRKKEEDLREEKADLRKKEEDLREEKRDLRKEKGVLLQQQQGDQRQPSLAGSQSDGSSQIVNQLLGPPLKNLPAVESLSDFLMGAPSQQVPVSKVIYLRIQQNAACSSFMHYFTVQHSAPELGLAVDCFLRARVRGQTEAWTAGLINETVVNFLQELDELAAAPTLKVSFIWERNQGDVISGMTLLSEKLQPLRPDGLIRHADNVRMLFKWEEKGAGDLREAIGDLHKESAMWPDIYYGPLEYILTLAAAGSQVQFVVLRKDGLVAQPLDLYDLSMMEGKVRLLLACVQLHRYLKVMTSALPLSVAPLNKLLVRKKDGVITTVLFAEGPVGPVVKKAIFPWSVFRSGFGISLEDVQEMYSATRLVPGLVHSSLGPEVSAAEDTYQVDLQPVGITPESARATSERECARAAVDLLSGLEGLHKVGWVHRDIRQENISSNASRGSYFLLDLELCQKQGRHQTGHLNTWDEHTLVEGRYMPASDLYSLGRVLRSWAGGLVNPVGGVFLSRLAFPASKLFCTTEDALALARDWLDSSCD